MSLTTSPTPRVWIATFVGLVFTIGVLTGVVVERMWLRPAFVGGPVGPMRAGGPGSPGGGRGLGRGERAGADRGGGPGRGGGGRGGGPMFGPPAQEYVDQLSQEVHLTTAQQAEVLKLLEAQESRLRAMQDEARATFIKEQEALHDQIAAVLTPEQAKTFREWVASRTGLRGRGGGPR